MIFDLIRGGITKTDLVLILLSFPVVLISLCVHEFAHGFMAKKLGDPTAEWHGRLTLNPAKHLDPLGTISMLLFGIGWARPVPINPRYFKNPKKGMAITGLAGPISNLILALFGAIMGRVTLLIFANLPASAVNERTYWLFLIISYLFYLFEALNISLAVFNMIPVPPFDGSRVFYFLLPDKYYFSVMRYERQIMIVTMLLLFTGALDVPLFYVREGIMNLFDFLLGWIPII